MSVVPALPVAAARARLRGLPDRLTLGLHRAPQLAAALQNGVEPPDAAVAVPDADITVDAMPYDDLPTDEEEAAAPPPDDIGILDEVGADEPGVVQPTQAALT